MSPKGMTVLYAGENDLRVSSLHLLLRLGKTSVVLYLTQLLRWQFYEIAGQEVGSICLQAQQSPYAGISAISWLFPGSCRKLLQLKALEEKKARRGETSTRNICPFLSGKQKFPQNCPS
ncbi:Hypothetical predicted protein [Marmota monax]|uniref:Uncharacterized protein n=1 Tax=Marmota monax TaxID=9995 RepID=A0A5E4BKM0_MARMO|nr:Hypothetical predicted protein [Marmota monax]